MGARCPPVDFMGDRCLRAGFTVVEVAVVGLTVAAAGTAEPAVILSLVFFRTA